jgi:hypothetical protein
MSHPFEAEFRDVLQNPEPYIDSVFACLGSEFLVMPKGRGFIEYAVFEQGYETLKRATGGFGRLDCATILRVCEDLPVAACVLRAMLGFSPPEWAHVASERSGTEVTQSYARTLDRQVRLAPLTPMSDSARRDPRLRALLCTACEMLAAGPPHVAPSQVHRLEKADTSGGTDSLQACAALGLPYPMVLYERFLGRPFAAHRDSVSEAVGGVVETLVERVLDDAGISARKTKRAEVVEGFDQAPDFIVPSEFNPVVVIEAKLAEDDGTARDKVTRVQHLAELSAQRGQAGKPPFEVIACIAGRGFRIRRADMRKLLEATRGKVFTPETVDRMVDCSRLREFRSKPAPDKA